MKPLFGGGSPAKTATMTIDAQATPVIGIVGQPSATMAVAIATANTPLAQFRVITDDEIDKLGAQTAAKAAEMSTKIMASVKASDTEAFGDQLNQLVATAKGLDPQKMANPGIIGKFKNMFGGVKEKMLAELQTTEKRMDALVGEMGKSVTLYTGRISDIEKMFEENYQTHEKFGAEVVVAEEMLRNLQVQLSSEGIATDAFAAQRQADLNSRIQRLEKKIDDLKRGMHLCKLAAPELRMMQENSRSLAQTFMDIKTVTIPAYMGVFSRYILNLEAKKGAELATSVQDATNAAFKMSADQLRQNVQVIATAKQRAVVDIETIQHMQTQLLASFDDAKKIADAGREARKAAGPKLQQMEKDLVARFAPQQITHNP